MLTLIRATYFFLTAFLPLSFLPRASELFEFPKFLILLGCTIVVAVSWLAYTYTHKDWQIPLGRYKAISYGVLAILATQALATLFSIHPYTSFWGYYTRFHQGLFSTICYTILYFGTLKFLNVRDVKKLIKVSVGVAIVIASLAILERVNISATCPFINPSLSEEIRPAPYSRAFFSNSCWKNLTNPTYRSFATLGQPNWLAAYLLPHIFLLLYLVAQKKKLSLPLVASYCLLVTAILFTKSRSGYLALGLSFLIYAYLRYRDEGRTVVKKLAIYATIPFVVAVITYLPTRFNQAPETTISTTTTTPVESTASGDIRKIVWSGALKLFFKRPILGFGPETFAYTYYQVRPVEHNYTTEWDYIYNKAHNEYLNAAATVGLVGLAAYLYWHWVILQTAASHIPESKKVQREQESHLHPYLPALGASLVSFAVTSFFGFSVVAVYLTLTLLAGYAGVGTTRVVSKITYPVKLGASLLITTLIILLPMRMLIADLRFNLGKSFATAGKHVEAKQELLQAVTLRQSEDLYHAYLGESLAVLGEKEAAAAEIAFTRQHNPHHLNYHKSRAKSWISLAEKSPELYRQAATELEEARRLAPTDPKLAYNLGLVYSRLGESDNSAKVMQDSITLKSNYYEPYYALTLLYESTKKLDQILPLLEQAKANLSTIPDPLQAKLDKYRITVP